MKKILTLLLAVIGLNTACGQRYENKDVPKFAELIADSAVVILDVRTAEEFDGGHIEGAVNIDVKKDDFLQQAKSLLPAGKTVAVYCRSGRRSAAACSLLSAEGYPCVNLKGGILAWQAEKRPVVR